MDNFAHNGILSYHSYVISSFKHARQKIRTTLIKHKRLMLVGCVLLVLALIALPVALLLAPHKKTSNPSNIKTYQRAGFSELASSIADPAPLVADGHQQVTSYGGVRIVDACNLLPLDQMNHEKILIYPNPIAGTYTRHYIGSDGTGAIIPGTAGFISSGDVNKCNYSLYDRTGVGLYVWQSSYTNAKNIRYAMAGYKEAGSVENGVAHLTQTRPDGSTSHLLQKNGVYAELFFRAALNKDKTTAEATANKLLPIIIQNFAKEVDAPSGTPKHRYDSPTFKGPIADACKLIDAATFQKLFQVTPSPVVQEEIPSAVGLIASSSDSTQTFHYIQSKCARGSGEPNYLDQKRLTALVVSYEETVAAREAFDFDLPNDGGAVLTRTYGDASYVVTKKHTRDPGTIVVRRGQFLLQLSFYDPAHKSNSTDPNYFAQQLEPIVQEVLARLPR